MTEPMLKVTLPLSSADMIIVQNIGQGVVLCLVEALEQTQRPLLAQPLLQ